MYIPDMSSILTRRSMVNHPLPFDKSNFTLDTSGVAGVFGGDEAVSAMATVNIYENRYLLGWYNSPGSYQTAKRYGLLPKSRFFRALFPGDRSDPAELFELDGLKGPKFIAARSGTIIEETGHLAALFMQECAAREGTLIGCRETQTVGVTIAELNHVPPTEVDPRRFRRLSSFLAGIPIAVSMGACIVCGVFEDWYSCSLIFLGMITTGTCCFVIGSGKLVFTHPDPAKGSPPGDGILRSGKEIVLLKGAEGAVNSITRGRFSLNFDRPQHDDIGWCSVLLTIQFVAQLLLIPQGSLFGQIMFVISLGVSWIYNACLSSFDKEKTQRDILINIVLGTPDLTKYTLGTYTTMVVFVLLVLQPDEPTKILNGLLPNDTKVWGQWKETIVGRLLKNEKLGEFVDADWELDGYSQEDKSLLRTLYLDAQAAYGGYVQYTAPK